MPLNQFPEDFLYNLLPDAVITDDVRGILQSVLGGFQDRVSDMRAAASSLESLINPSTVPPLGGSIRVEYTDANSGDTIVNYLAVDSTTPAQSVFVATPPGNALALDWCGGKLGIPSSSITYVAYGDEVVLVTFYSAVGDTVTRTLDVDDTTPNGSDASALATWAANILGMPLASIISVQYGSDVLRTVDGNFLQQLAASIGALIPVTQAATPEEQIAIQRQLVLSHFPRLRIKGTVQSFELLARTLGCDDVAVTPLWSRLSPHRPEDYGNPENVTDFAAIPEYVVPATLPDTYYDPQVFRDGPFTTWPAADDPVQIFSGSPTDSNYLPIAINGRSPFITVAPLQGSAILGIPNSGSYTFTGGDYAIKPYVDFPEANMRVSALAPGTGFNGMAMTATTVATGSGNQTALRITDRLSAVKYRSSYYGLTLTQDIDTAPVTLVQPNASSPSTGGCQAGLPLTGGHAMVSSGTVVISYGSVVMAGSRQPANPSSLQLDLDSVQNHSNQVVNDLEFVRPATRSYLHVLTGFSWEDGAPYAPYPSAATLFETTSNGSVWATGSVPASQRPGTDAVGRFYVVKNDGTLPMEAMTDPVNPQGVLLFSGSIEFYGILNGSYDFSTNNYWFQSVGLAQYTGYARALVDWATIDVETRALNAEPSDADKSSGMIGTSVRPQDELLDAPDILDDDFPWGSAPALDGVLQTFDASTDTATPVPVANQPTVRNQNGEEFSLAIDDSTTVILPPRSILTAIPTLDSNGLLLKDTYAKTPYASIGNSTYRLGLLGNTLVVDPQAFYVDSINADLAAWFAFSERPDDPLAPVDQSPLALSGDAQYAAYTYALTPDARTWDESLGWVLTLASGAYLDVEQYRGLTTAYTVAFSINPGAATSGSPVTILRVGDKIWFTLNPANVGGAAVLEAYATNQTGNAVQIGQISLPIGQNTFVFLTSTGLFGYGTLGASLTVVTADNTFEAFPFDDSDTTLYVGNGGGRTFSISDLRVYSTNKSQNDLSLILLPDLTTVVFPNTSYFPNLIATERYQYTVLANGRVYPARMANANPSVAQKRTQRYATDGTYVGPDPYQLTGWGGGVPYSSTYKLGLQGVDVPAHGQTVVSATAGQLPGQDGPWFNNPQGYYPVVTAGTASLASTSGDPWPNDSIAANSTQQRVYVQGDGITTAPNDVFEVTVISTNGNVGLKATPVSPIGGRTELLTDAVTQIATAYGMKLTVGYSAGSQPYVYTTTNTGTIDSPSTYVYLNSVNVVNVTGSDTSTRFVSPTPVIQSPTRTTAGALEFYNTESLPAGRYRFTLDCGNVGQIDSDFKGFNLVATIGATNPITQFSMTALANPTTVINPEGLTVVEFQLTQSITCPWVLRLNWTNPRQIPAQGVGRQLAVYGYAFDLLETQLYGLGVGGSPGDPAILTLQSTGSTAQNYIPTNSPGGWMAKINAAGQIVYAVHESDPSTVPASFVPTEVTPDSLPVSLLRTGCTDDRLEDLQLNSAGPYLLPDDLPPDVPYIVSATSFGTLTYDGIHYFMGSISSSGTQFNVGRSQQFNVVTQGPYGPLPAPISYSSGTRSADLTYVWAFWDGSSITTKEPTCSKLLNRGGDLHWSVTANDELGQSATATNDLYVNAPPAITGLYTDQNNDVIPYPATVIAESAEADGWAWFDLGPDGTGSTLINPSYYPSGGSLVQYPIGGTAPYTTGQTLRVVAWNTLGGTNGLDVYMKGTPIKPPVVSSVSVSADGNPATNLGFIIEATNNLYAFVTASDPQNYPLTFTWSYNGRAISTLPGATTSVLDNGDGTFTAELVIPIGSATPGQNIPVTCVVTSTPTDIKPAQTSTRTALITVIHSQAPVISSIAVNPVSLVLSAGSNIQYSTVAYSPLGFQVINQWNFDTNPTGGIAPFALYSTGTNSVSLPTITLAGFSVIGTLIVTDPYGVSASHTLPQVVVTS